MPRTPKRRNPDSGLDFAENAFRVMREATGQDERTPPPEPRKKKNRAAVALSKLGAKKGGRASRLLKNT